VRNALHFDENPQAIRIELTFYKALVSGIIRSRSRENSSMFCNRARLQSCRKRRKIDVGFSPRGIYSRPPPSS
jgi:hypothetical protein